MNLLYNATNGNSDTDKYTYGSYSGFFSTNTKNIYAVSLEPGYYLSKHGLGYLKIGYASGQSSITTDTSSRDFGRQSGVLFGFGFKHGLNAAHPNVFWGLEAYQINFSSKTTTDSSTGVQWTSKPTLLFGKVNLGYMFYCCLLNLKIAIEPNVFRRTTNHNSKPARFHNKGMFCCLIPECKLVAP